METWRVLALQRISASLRPASGLLRTLFYRVAVHGERGQGMVEYALVVMFVTIVVVGSLTIVGQQLSNIFSNVTLSLGP